MKAAICTKYGPPEVVQIKDIETPTPKDNEVLIKIYYTTVSSGDARSRSFDVPPLPWLPYRAMMGFFRPRQPIFGFSLAGDVEAVGKDVAKFKKGDRIYGSAGMSMGTHAEYISLPEDGLLSVIPKNLSYEDVSTVTFGPMTALHFLERGKIGKGDKVLIYGASGSLGVYAVQLAKLLGAEVTAVASGANEKLVRSLGADHFIDYKKEDFSAKGKIYDAIFDTVGKSSYSGSVKSLKKDGYYLRAVAMTLVPIVQGIWTNLTSKKKVIGGVAKDTPERLEFLGGLLAKEDFKVVIDKRYLFKDIAKAYAYVDKGHKKGDVVIKVQNEKEAK